MRFALFYHSFSSCWNHGNVHFLRGVARVLRERGHRVTVYEPADGWSRVNALQQDGGAEILQESERLVPGVDVVRYDMEKLNLDEVLDDADVVVAHEWNDPALICQLGERRRRGGRFALLFHDTHHRAVTAPHELEGFALEPYDLVLVFGEALRDAYQRRGWGRRVVTWHEAADTSLFRPEPNIAKQMDLVWIGNWGDGERDQELRQFLVEPASRAGLNVRVHGVRFPEDLREALRCRGFSFAGWLPNHRVPAALAPARMTVHIPRRPYVEALRGIPTIRVFEALACGIPLISALWQDTEGLFPEGCYLTAKDTASATRAMRLVTMDHALAAQMSRAGPRAVSARHTCAHRVDQLLDLLARHRLIKTRAQPETCRGSERMVTS